MVGVKWMDEGSLHPKAQRIKCGRPTIWPTYASEREAEMCIANHSEIQKTIPIRFFWDGYVRWCGGYMGVLNVELVGVYMVCR